MRQIKRGLDVSMGVLQYHLYSLETEGQIVSQRRGLYKRFYPNLMFAQNQQEILNVLSQESERDLLLYLVNNSGATQKELSVYTKLSPGTINWHMKRLRLSGLVTSSREGQFIRYTLSADPNEILKLLQSYHPTIWATWADRIANVFGEISAKERKEYYNEKGE